MEGYGCLLEMFLRWTWLAPRSVVPTAMFICSNRDGWRYQNGWVFGNIRNGLWPLNFGNLYCIFPETPVWKALVKGPKSALQILRMEMTSPPLELFRKFIRFGTATRPLLANFSEFPPSIEWKYQRARGVKLRKIHPMVLHKAHWSYTTPKT